MSHESQTATRHELCSGDDERRRWRIKLLMLLWAAMALMLSFLVWMHLSQRARAEHIASCTAVVNSLGDVVEWPEGAAEVTGERDMVGRNLFQLVPTLRRDRNLSQFERAVSGGPPYQFPHLWWRHGEQNVSVSFVRRSETTIAATLTR